MLYPLLLIRAQLRTNLKEAPVEVPCGTDLQCFIDENNALHIQGSGTKYEPNADLTSFTTVVFTEAPGLTELSSSSFKGITTLATIELPDTITSIPASCFSGCSSLSSFTLSDSVTSIGENAFYKCTSLSIFNIGDSSQLSSIGPNAFHTTAITSLTIPSSYTKHSEKYAFYGLTALETVIIKPNSISAFPDLEFKDSTKLTTIDFQGTGVLSISMKAKTVSVVKFAEGITQIGALNNFDNVVSLTFPTSLEVIGNGGFVNFDALESIEFPPNLKSIGNNAFSSCRSLKQVTIPDGVQLGEYAFQLCSALTSINVPNFKFDETHFYGCENVKSITIRKTEGINELYVPNGAGKSCTSLTFPEDITTVAEGMMQNFESLDSFKFEQFTVFESNSMTNMKSIKTIKFSEGLTKIGEGAFAGSSANQIEISCSSKAQISLEGFTTLETLVFYDTTGSATSFTPTGKCYAKNVQFPESITKIPDNAFQYFVRLQTYQILAHITEIGNYAFASSALSTITLPSTVTKLGTHIFEECGSLLSIDLSQLSSSITELPESMFENCNELKPFSIPEHVTSIASRCFYGCRVFHPVVIPKTITKIGDLAFAAVAYMQVLSIEATNIEWGDKVFDKCDKFGTLKYTGTEKLTEMTGFPYSKIHTIELDKLSTITTEELQPFVNVKTLTLLNIGEVLTLNILPTISTLNFIGTGKLSLKITGSEVSTIKLSGIETIGESAFEGISTLRTVNFDSSLKTIEQNAFKGTGLRQFSIANTIQTINANAFGDCKSLIEVAIPMTLKLTTNEKQTLDSSTMIDPSAFSGCTSLTSVTLKAGSELPNAIQQFFPASTIKTLVIEEGPTQIPDNFFADIPELSDLTLPATVQTLKGGFSSNPNLNKVTINIENQHISFNDNVFYNKDGTKLIASIPKASKFTVPETVVTLGEKAFYGNTKLEEITIGSTVTKAEPGSLLNCPNLKVINYGGIKEIQFTEQVIDEREIVINVPYEYEGETLFGSKITREPEPEISSPEPELSSAEPELSSPEQETSEIEPVSESDTSYDNETHSEEISNSPEDPDGQKSGNTNPGLIAGIVIAVVVVIAAIIIIVVYIIIKKTPKHKSQDGYDGIYDA